MRLALGQMEVIPGRLDLNTSTILDMAEEVRQARMVIFGNGCPGVFTGRYREQDAFIRIAGVRRQIIQSSRNGICAVCNVAADWDKTGDDGIGKKIQRLLLPKTAY